MNLSPKEWSLFADAAGINLWLALGLGTATFVFVDWTKRPLGLTGRSVYWLTISIAISASLVVMFLKMLDTDLEITQRMVVRAILRSIITALVAIVAAAIRRNLPDKRIAGFFQHRQPHPAKHPASTGTLENVKTIEGGTAPFPNHLSPDASAAPSPGAGTDIEQEPNQ